MDRFRIASSTGFHVFGGTIWMVGHSMTRAPKASRRARRSADWEAARVMRTVLPVSSMLGDFCQDFSGSAGEHALSQFNSDLFGALGFACQLIRYDALTIETRNEAFDREFA